MHTLNDRAQKSQHCQDVPIKVRHICINYRNCDPLTLHNLLAFEKYKLIIL